MGQRNTLCTQQMLDLQLEQGLNQNIVDFTNQSIHSTLPASANLAEQSLMFRDSHVYANQYHSFQNFHAVPNLGPSIAAPPSFYNPCMFPASSSRNFQTDVGANIGEFNRSSQVVDSITGFGKRKNAEAVAGNQQTVNGLASSSSPPSFLSLNVGLPQWDPAGQNLVSGSNFVHPDYQERGNIQTAQGAAHRSVRSRSSVSGLQLEPAYFPHHNYVLQGTHMVQPMHPSSSMWMGQFGTGNNVVDGTNPAWNYNHAITYLHGRSLGSGAFEMPNMAVQAFHDASSTANAPVLFAPASLPNFHQHLTPMQPMQVHSFGHPAQISVPYQLPVNNLPYVGVNPSNDGPDSGPRIPQFPANFEQINRPLQLQRVAPDFNHGRVRIISPEDAAAMGIARFYGAANVVDQHQDLRMDIDEMSYEELLALEEQIGDVKTGLTEDYIIKNLKTSVHNPQTPSLPSENPKFSQEAEACIICQVEYEKDEIIGTLNCGHNYHGECIKQWLLVKNLCPICKTAAFTTGNGEG